LAHERVISNKKTSEALKLALKVRSSDLGKAGPGARAKADARRHFKAKGSGSSIIPGVYGFVPQNTYCLYHKSDPPLSCKSSVKVSKSPSQGNGNNPPPGDGSNFDVSQHKGGPSPFKNSDYDNKNHNRENVDFNDQRTTNHSYDGHVEKCFNMQENRNKQSSQKFVKSVRDYIESPETERIDGSFRYETSAFIIFVSISRVLSN
jgi:hypothetical protein